MSREEPISSLVVVLGPQQAPVVVQTRNKERVVVQEERCDSDVGAGTEATFTLETVGKSQDLGDGFEERIEEIDRGLKLFDRSESLNLGNEKDRMLGDEISSEHATKSLAFEDKWLPDRCYRKVSSPLPSIPPEAKDSLLIDRNSGTWKKEDIKQLFLPREADAIISIPLSLRMPTDWLVWSKTPSGNFSSRSAYRLLASNASTTNPSSSNPIPQRFFWRGIWSLRVPHKVKHFTWRACNNSLPTMDNLFR
nr:hypothetical protein CFP56_52090 [Quercus suber]